MLRLDEFVVYVETTLGKHLEQRLTVIIDLSKIFVGLVVDCLLNETIY